MNDATGKRRQYVKTKRSGTSQLDVFLDPNDPAVIEQAC